MYQNDISLFFILTYFTQSSRCFTTASLENLCTGKCFVTFYYYKTLLYIVYAAIDKLTRNI